MVGGHWWPLTYDQEHSPSSTKILNFGLFQVVLLGSGDHCNSPVEVQPQHAKELWLLQMQLPRQVLQPMMGQQILGQQGLLGANTRRYQEDDGGPWWKMLYS